MFEKLETPKYKIIQLTLSALLLITCFTIEWFFGSKHGNGIIPTWGFLIMYGFVYAIISIDVFKEMFEAFTEKEIFNEQLLMVIATLGALLIGFVPKADNMFVEAVLVMELFQVGELFEMISERKSRKSISSLLKARPETVNAYNDKLNKFVKIEAKDVKTGTIIVVQPGESIALDGVIVEGDSNLNTVAITGESIPRLFKCGQEVFSGCININKVIKVKVTKTYNDSTISKIIELVENANESKNKVSKFIDKFCKWYTPIILVCAILVGLIGGLIQRDVWYKWLTIGLSCLVISCPCALVISVPLSYFVAAGLAARKGILIKGSNYLEQLSKIKTIVFDKTGTLTESNLVVAGIYPTDGIKETELISKANSLESFSTHPIAKAICLVDKTKKISKAKNVEEIAGLGMKGVLDNKILLVGNEKLMKENGIIVTYPDQVGSYVFVSYDNNYLGCIVVADQIKKDTYKAIPLFKQTGIKTVMLTGDLAYVANDVGHKLNIDEIHSQLLPNEKIEILNKVINVKKSNEIVAFVGDGINDAPSIARADIGISMGAIGSSAAIEASDVVLMEDKLSKIDTSIKISKKANRISRFNIVFALIVKAIVFVLTCCSTLISKSLPIWSQIIMPLAIFADVGVTIIAVLNSMRCARIKKE